MRPSAPLICWAEAGRRPCRDPAATPLTSPGRFQEATGVRDFYGCRRMNKNLRQSHGASEDESERTPHLLGGGRPEAL